VLPVDIAATKLAIMCEQDWPTNSMENRGDDERCNRAWLWHCLASSGGVASCPQQTPEIAVRWGSEFRNLKTHRKQENVAELLRVGSKKTLK